jgi:hypothetical protein
MPEVELYIQGANKYDGYRLKHDLVKPCTIGSSPRNVIVYTNLRCSPLHGQISLDGNMELCYTDRSATGTVIEDRETVHGRTVKLQKMDALIIEDLVITVVGFTGIAAVAGSPADVPLATTEVDVNEILRLAAGDRRSYE